MDPTAEIADLKRRLARAEDTLRRHGEHARDQAVRDSEEQLPALFDLIDEGFCIIEVTGGEDGEAVDYRFLQTNASFERQTGLINAIGRSMRELEPDHEEHWFERYSRIAATQTPERFEDRAEALGRWYDVYAFPVGNPDLRRVGILFRDVMRRKRHDEELSRSNALLRTTVDSSLQIIQLFKAVRDDRDTIVDFEWQLTNKQWDDRYGSNVGKRLLTENPAVVESGVWDKFLRVIETGVPLTHEHYYKHEQFDGWFLQTMAKAGDGILLSTLDVTDRKRAEIALRESEAKYRSLFEGMGQGYCELELVRDQQGHAVDQLYLELNPAFERMFGIAAADAKGRRASEVFDYVDPTWTETFEEVVRTGTFKRFENQHGPLGKWYEVFVYPAGGDGVVMLYEDVTDRKRAEIALRESEERQAFLLALGDALRAVTSAGEKISAAARLLGERLEATRVLWAEYDWERKLAHIFGGWFADGAQSFPPVMQLDAYDGEVLSTLRAGKTVRVDNVGLLTAEPAYAAIAALGVQALLSVPLVIDGVLKVNVSIHQQDPRHWTDEEVALVSEVAERLWAEVVRARAEDALRASEERFRQFAVASSAGLWIRDAATLDMEYISPAISTIYGLKAEDMLGSVEKWAAAILPEDRRAALDHLEAARQGESVVHEFRIQRATDRAFRWLRNTDFPLHDDGHVQRIGGIAEDVTEAKLMTAHQGVLVAELQHRVRNIMAIIRSMALRTADGASDVEDYRALLEGRLLALARVQVLLTRQGNAGGALRDIIESEVSVQAAHHGQFELRGPDIRLSPKAVEVLTLAFHELATNALKYGAFSAPNGTLRVSWSTFEKRDRTWIALEWIESGAPSRGPVTRRGFGSDLIEGRIPYELGGTGKVEIGPGGAHCRLEFPLRLRR